jgi:glucose-6-phosphate 1-dehydrogenase
MEPPSSLDPESIRDEKVKALPSIKAFSALKVTTQKRYGRLMVQVSSRDYPAKAYIDEEGIPNHSGTETYAALRLYLDNWRWKGVPFLSSLR